jgi:hypothetical protein
MDIDNFFKGGKYQNNSINSIPVSDLCESINRNVLDYNGLQFELNDNVDTDINELYQPQVVKKDSVVDFNDQGYKTSVSMISDDYINITDIDTSTACNDLVDIIQRYTKNELIKLQTVIDELTITDKYSNIGPVSTLDYLIEGSSSTKNSIIESMANLNDYIFRWRKIAGDGNCFYRAVIFSYFENIIVTKNIELLAYSIIELNYLFISPEIMNLVDCKTSQSVLEKLDLVTKILVLIYFALQLGTPQDIQRAYEMFLKAINKCRNFDLALILYFRLKMYQYVSNNTNKLYSTEFSVKIGNLLPIQYETEDGNFLYEKFYDEYLLKMYQDAEKIVIYLTPFVLRINLKVIIYEFGAGMAEHNKELMCGLADKPVIAILYKHFHYDLVYSKEYFNEHTRYLSLYVNLTENLKIINEDIYKEVEKRRTFEGAVKAPNDINQINTYILNNINSYDKQEIEDKKVVNYGDINSFLSSNLDSKKDDHQEDFQNIVIKHTGVTSTICHICHENIYLPPELPIYCIECIENEVTSYVFTKYLNFLDVAKEARRSKPDTNIKEIYQQSKYMLILVFDKKYIKVNNEQIPSNTITTLLHKDMKMLIKEIKVKLCIVCERNINPNEYVLKTPCDCCLCSDSCINKYISYLIHTRKKDESKLTLI